MLGHYINVSTGVTGLERRSRGLRNQRANLLIVRVITQILELFIDHGQFSME